MPHGHSVVDQDPHFIINADTRTVSSSSGDKITIVQFDHNSEVFSFELPRIIDGHDMALCDVTRVHYINVGSSDKSYGSYVVDDLQIHPEDPNKVVCTWLLSRNATMYPGTLQFAIEFACTVDGEISYSWNTAPYKNVIVSPGINNTNEIIEEYPDIIKQIANISDEAKAIAEGLRADADNGVFDGANGVNGTNGTNGKDGYTPVKGIDYWTQEDVNQINADVTDIVDQEITKSIIKTTVYPDASEISFEDASTLNDVAEIRLGSRNLLNIESAVGGGPNDYNPYAPNSEVRIDNKTDLYLGVTFTGSCIACIDLDNELPLGSKITFSCTGVIPNEYEESLYDKTIDIGISDTYLDMRDGPGKFYSDKVKILGSIVKFDYSSSKKFSYVVDREGLKYLLILFIPSNDLTLDDVTINSPQLIYGQSSNEFTPYVTPEERTAEYGYIGEADIWNGSSLIPNTSGIIQIKNPNQKYILRATNDTVIYSSTYNRDLIAYADNKLGDIETALDSIITIQNGLIGGAST